MQKLNIMRMQERLIEPRFKISFWSVNCHSDVMMISNFVKIF